MTVAGEGAGRSGERQDEFDTILTMTKKRQPINSRQRKLLSLIILGAGLVFIGLAAFFTLPEPDQITDGGPGIPSSTIPVEVGYSAPSLTLADLNGRQHSLKDYRGQVVLVNLWATWCPPCKAEMPTLQAYYEDYQAHGFVTIAVNDGDPAEDVAAFVGSYGLTFPVWLDPTYEATERAFETLNLPSSFVIDREGVIRLRWVGEIDRDTLEKYVTPMILE
jgi:peroxiredoxin